MKLYYEIMNMEIGNRCFLFSIVFQVAGALILLLKSFSRTKKQIAGQCFDVDDGKVDNEAYVTLKYWTVSKMLTQIYYNRLSFVYLVVGYSLTIWAELGNYSKNEMFKYVVVCSVFLLAISVLIAFLFSLVIASFNRKVKFKNIPSGAKIDVATGYSTTASGKKIMHIKTMIKE